MFIAAIANARVDHDMVRDRDIGRLFDSAERARLAVPDVSNPVTAYWLAMWRGILAIELGEFDLGEAELHRAARAAEREGSALFAAWCRIHIAWVCLGRGEPERVLEMVGNLYESPDARHVKALAALAHLSLGRHDDADRLSEAAVRGVEYELITPWVITILNAVRGKVLVALGRPHEALAHVRKPIARTGASITPMTLSLLIRMEAERAVGDLEAARDVARMAYARIERHAESLPEQWRGAFRSTLWNARTIELARELLVTTTSRRRLSPSPDPRLDERDGIGDAVFAGDSIADVLRSCDERVVVEQSTDRVREVVLARDHHARAALVRRQGAPHDDPKTAGRRRTRRRALAAARGGPPRACPHRRDARPRDSAEAASRARHDS